MTTIDLGMQRPGYLSRVLALLSRVVRQRPALHGDQLRVDELMTWSPERLADLGVRPGDFAGRDGVELSNLRRSPWS